MSFRDSTCSPRQQPATADGVEGVVSKVDPTVLGSALHPEKRLPRTHLLPFDGGALDLQRSHERLTVTRLDLPLEEEVQILRASVVQVQRSERHAPAEHDL
jgi:hypothetical protein